MAVALVLVLGALLWFRQPLSDRLWPETRAQQLRADAAEAMQEGRLTSADGSGAKELYEAALALDPDRMEAREGLAAVGQAAVARGERALAERRLDDAASAIALARELMVPTARTDALASRLLALQQGTAGLDRLLAMADAARRAGRLEGTGNAALPLYQRALLLDASNTAALEGREDTLSDLLLRARQALARGALSEAGAVVTRVQEADAGHVGLPDALDEVAAHARERTLAAERALQRGRLDDALRHYRQVLQADPGNVAANQGIGRIVEAHAERSSRLAADFDFRGAEAALQRAREIGSESPLLADAQADLVRARQARKRLDQSAGPTGSTRERRARLQQLLTQAEQAQARGDLVTPPGDSAFDKLRAARALAPADPRVREASYRLLSAAASCFEEELRRNRLTRAGACLDALSQLGPRTAESMVARTRLAQRWVGIGEQRLGASEVAGANAALAAARGLDPATPGLDELAERIRLASAASTD
ncbi:MAG: hypothetical protein M3Q40_03295 [Pseudomonadota bacterium]|nr:hypothetical protein [Pseudomonadota bacterium]